MIHDTTIEMTRFLGYEWRRMRRWNGAGKLFCRLSMVVIYSKQSHRWSTHSTIIIIHSSKASLAAAITSNYFAHTIELCVSVIYCRRLQVQLLFCFRAEMFQPPFHQSQSVAKQPSIPVPRTTIWIMPKLLLLHLNSTTQLPTTSCMVIAHTPPIEWNRIIMRTKYFSIVRDVFQSRLAVIAARWLFSQLDTCFATRDLTIFRSLFTNRTWFLADLLFSRNQFGRRTRITDPNHLHRKSTSA